MQFTLPIKEADLAATRAKVVQTCETCAIVCGVAQDYFEGKAGELAAKAKKPVSPEHASVSENFARAAEYASSAAEAIGRLAKAKMMLADAYRSIPDTNAIVGAAAEFTIEKVVSLAPLAAEHKNAFQTIVSQECVYTRIKRGHPWTQDKIDDFFGYLAQDAQPCGELRNCWHAIIVEKTCVGIVGIHEAPYDKTIADGRALTIFVHKDARRRGIGAQAARLALLAWGRKSWSRVAIDVRRNNAAMQFLAEKLQTTPGIVCRKRTPKEFVRYWA